MAILLLADHDNKTLTEQTAKALTAASMIGGEVHVLVAGQAAGAAVEAASRLSGVTRVLVCESDALAHQLAEPLADLIVSLAPGYDTIMAAATSVGKSVMPRVAALLDVMQISEIIDVLSADTFKRPIYAGNAVQTVQATDVIKVVSVRTAAFSPAPHGPLAAVGQISMAAFSSSSSTFVSDALSAGDRPELTSARMIVSGGRALGSSDAFMRLLPPVADKLGAALGASRAAVDAGYAPNDWQVGQTGKVVAPDLYIAVGISGAIQHLAGMKGSKFIVAVNSDADAPIFQVADYGLVGDLFDIMPELERAL